MRSAMARIPCVLLPVDADKGSGSERGWKKGSVSERGWKGRGSSGSAEQSRRWAVVLGGYGLERREMMGQS